MIRYCVALVFLFSTIFISFGFLQGVFADGNAVKIPPPLEGASLGVANAPQSLETDNIKIITSDGGALTYKVEIADDEEERRIGMMFRKDVPEGTGMLFVFDDIAKRHFWMRNTLIPLDIIFLREDGVITKIHHMAEPRSLKLLSSEVASLAALELFGGEAMKKNINIGDRVIFHAFESSSAPPSAVLAGDE